MSYRIMKYNFRNGDAVYKVFEDFWFSKSKYHGVFYNAKDAQKAIEDLVGWPKVETYARYYSDGSRNVEDYFV